MPFCLVRAKSEMFLPPIREAIYVGENAREFLGLPLPKLVKNLPPIVAEALSVPGTEGELAPGEIEIKVESFGPRDIHTKDIEIIVWANEYIERKRNLKERQEIITRKVRELLPPDTTGFVWVLLQPGSFGEF